MQRNKSSRNQRTASRKRSPYKSNEILGQNTSEVIVIPRSLGWAPRRLRCNLRYSTTGVLNHAGFTYANSRYIPTYVYDVDPTLGNTAVPGLAEYGAIWRLYRVRSATCKVTFSNRESFSVCVYLCPVNTDPGANSTSAQTYLSNRLCKEKSIGPLTGNGICTLSSKATTSDFAGVLDTQQIDTYCGSTNGGTAPTNNWYWMVGVVTDGSNLASGVLTNVVVDMEVEFFELLTPAA